MDKTRRRTTNNAELVIKAICISIAASLCCGCSAQKIIDLAKPSPINPYRKVACFYFPSTKGAWTQADPNALESVKSICRSFYELKPNKGGLGAKLPRLNLVGLVRFENGRLLEMYASTDYRLVLLSGDGTNVFVNVDEDSISTLEMIHLGQDNENIPIR